MWRSVGLGLAVGRQALGMAHGGGPAGRATEIPATPAFRLGKRAFPTPPPQR